MIEFNQIDEPLGPASISTIFYPSFLLSFLAFYLHPSHRSATFDIFLATKSKEITPFNKTKAKVASDIVVVES